MPGGKDLEPVCSVYVILIRPKLGLDLIKW
jgi:hypothetical protein